MDTTPSFVTHHGIKNEFMDSASSPGFAVAGTSESIAMDCEGCLRTLTDVLEGSVLIVSCLVFSPEHPDESRTAIVASPFHVRPAFSDEFRAATVVSQS